MAMFIVKSHHYNSILHKSKSPSSTLLGLGGYFSTYISILGPKTSKRPFSSTDFSFSDCLFFVFASSLQKTCSRSLQTKNTLLSFTPSDSKPISPFLQSITSSLKFGILKENRSMGVFFVKPVFTVLIVVLSLLLVVVLLSPSIPFSQIFITPSTSHARSEIWGVKRIVEWRPCKWWLEGHLTALPLQSNGYIRVDCYGGLNQMRRDLCDGVGVARLLNATLVLPKFEVAAYWNESSGFADVFDVDYFIQHMKGFITVVKDLPAEIASKEPVQVDCSKRKGHFDYIESVLPSLLEHHYISITPAVSQRRDRYPLYAKAALCQACYKALHLTKNLEKKASELVDAIPKPFMSLHLRFEPDMVAYSQCEYQNLSMASNKAIDAARGDRKPWTGEMARIWRSRGKCPLTPNETALILKALAIPNNTTIYLAAGDGLMEIEELTSVYTNVYTKSTLLSSEDFTSMHGNTKAALDYHVSINSDSYVATYFGNMDKMVSAMRACKGLYKTLFLSRKAFAEFSSKGLEEAELVKAMWKVHKNDFIMGRGSALPDCFCESKL